MSAAERIAALTERLRRPKVVDDGKAHMAEQKARREAVKQREARRDALRDELTPEGITIRALDAFDAMDLDVFDTMWPLLRRARAEVDALERVRNERIRPRRHLNEDELDRQARARVAEIALADILERELRQHPDYHADTLHTRLPPTGDGAQLEVPEGLSVPRFAARAALREPQRREDILATRIRSALHDSRPPKRGGHGYGT